MTNQEITTDYLVVGAGAAGMAFTDELLTHSDATVAIVDRRSAPGGHWIDAYPYVRLHQPSAFYGVGSVPLGQDRIDATGTNAGYYELAGAAEIQAYYDEVMRRRFLPSGRVRYFPECSYQGDGRFVSRSGVSWQASVGRKIVDTTYLEGEIPATSPPPFEVAEGARCVPAGDLARLKEVPERYVIIGGGKTAVDACVWLLEQGVAPTAIQWIKPREAWWLNRRFHQPRTLLPDFYRGMAIQLEAMAQASSLEDLALRLEAGGFFLRVDPAVEPTMLHGAVISEAERDLVSRIKDVVRLGHVQRIERDAIVLDKGRVPTTPSSLHVHCAARGLAHPPHRPIFEAGRVTIQPFMWSFACYQFAMLGVAEATIADDAAKNRLFPPISYWDTVHDYVTAYLAALANERARNASAPLAAWARGSRLNPFAGMEAHRESPVVLEAGKRIKRFGQEAVANLARLQRAGAA